MSVNFLLIFFVLIVVAMIAFILVQKGTGATAGSAFGSGASSTVFGAKGSGNFLTKTTMVLAFLFFAISLFMAVNASKQFTTAQTGEVDLGVVGTLDTSDSDMPELKPATPIETDGTSDVPLLSDKAVENVEVTTGTATQNASEIKDDIVNKAIEIKDDAVEKAGQTREVIEEKVEELKESNGG